MVRYEYSDIVRTNYKLMRGKDIRNRLHIQTPIFLNVYAPGDKYINSQVGDRLDLLSYDEYGTPDYWYIIASANGIYDSIYIKEGGVIRIPAMQPGLNDTEYVAVYSER